MAGVGWGAEQKAAVGGTTVFKASPPSKAGRAHTQKLTYTEI